VSHIHKRIGISQRSFETTNEDVRNAVDISM